MHFLVVELPTFGFGEINKEIINLNIGLSDLIKLATDQNRSFENSKLFNLKLISDHYYPKTDYSPNSPILIDHQ